MVCSEGCSVGFLRFLAETFIEASFRVDGCTPVLIISSLSSGDLH